METLKELAELAHRVSDQIEKLSVTVKTADQFNRLQNQLEQIESVMPGHKLIVIPRVRWYLHGLASFERHFVELIESGELLKKNSRIIEAPYLLVDYLQLFHLLRRSLLGDSFGMLYKKLEALLERLVEATATREGRKKDLWPDRLNELRNELIFPTME